VFSFPKGNKGIGFEFLTDLNRGAVK